jgi:hypothetical protein
MVEHLSGDGLCRRASQGSVDANKGFGRRIDGFEVKSLRLRLALRDCTRSHIINISIHLVPHLVAHDMP